jgi:hypothetical protein
MGKFQAANTKLETNSKLLPPPLPPRIAGEDEGGGLNGVNVLNSKLKDSMPANILA